MKLFSKESKDNGSDGKSTRNATANYASIFMTGRKLETRQCVYISRHVHATVSKIVKAISGRDITVGGYIDGILIEHLETHKDEITELYRQELAKKESGNMIDF
ncbi:MAG: DUF3408 domain-containing protein [Tannerella sp.]|jgi:hypothetical protein|nr:DUF3408 domain-containing protein [Tannerella sp.]